MKKIKFKLKKSEEKFLRNFVKRGQQKVRAIARANALLLANDGWDYDNISLSTQVHRQTIWRVVKRYTKEGINFIVKEKPRSGQPRKYDNKKEAEIIASACTNAPKGHKRWTIRLLAKKLKVKSGFKTINRETIRLILKKAKLSLG